MTSEDAIKTLKENYCAMCAYGSQDMDSCDIRSCDNRDAIKALEQELCEDAINRAEAIKALEYDLSIEADGGLDKYRTVIKDLLNAIYNTQKKAIEELPPVKPTNSKMEQVEQEPFINKPCVSNGVCEHDKNKVLDKIRAEIEKDAFTDVNNSKFISVNRVNQIFDKYRAESEDEE